MKKKICISLLIISVLIALFEIQTTYAKYLTSAEGKGSMKVARWKILVNNEDIRDDKTLQSEITPVFEGSEHIKENVIAPTSVGYFDLIIDASEADVSFKYTIDITPNIDSSVKDMKIIKYIINNEETILTDNTFKIEKEVLHKDNTEPINIRVYIMWDDSESSTMDNQEDTKATLTNDAKLNVNLHFTQKAI